MSSASLTLINTFFGQLTICIFEIFVQSELVLQEAFILRALELTCSHSLKRTTMIQLSIDIDSERERVCAAWNPTKCDISFRNYFDLIILCECCTE
ncbi:hypothetical protein RB195_005884 [Necator americanus]|uniref:Uncharacterized protein n=1 Tax=Necator americanus TaxID=51031 RepID=A0ABR1BT38_NECAM